MDAPTNTDSTFVALLRGINVGGRNKVPMAQLRDALTSRGLVDVRTYIASGNVVLRAPESPEDIQALTSLVQSTIAEDFGFDCSVLVRRGTQIERIAAAIPPEWDNDHTRKSDVLYLFDDVDTPQTLADLPLARGIDTARYTPGAILWSVPRQLQTRSGMPRIVGTPIYPGMTIRNVRTARTLAAMLRR